ncbi:MAG: DUF5054 domain-containing protein [Acidobacteria bacterium]|nr:MAG: DUF5054 domain-containing protein [Acidobacteriota bacterium]
MKRREFVRDLLLAGGALACPPRLGLADATQPVSTRVKRVLVAFTCHLDVGFTNTQAAVLAEYFDQYYPAAMRTAEALRQSGEDRYVWSTGSWLLYEYLEHVTGAARSRAEHAIGRGEMAWYAVPFNLETEMLDRSMVEGAMGIAQTLDRRFNQTTTGAKMSDVPGHSRGLVAPFAANGVRFLDIGVNGASTVPEVPPLFVWKEPGGASITMMYHHGYGGVLQVPGSDLAVAIEVRNDNAGPHSVAEVKKIYAGLRKQFPGAKVSAANLSEIALAVEPYKSSLPVVTQEIGDTWIYGVASDPVKISRYREVMRMRQEWVRQGKFKVGDSTDLRLLQHLLLPPEHTWGVDTKRLKDYEHYTPKALATVANSPRFRWAEQSWREKRRDIDQAVESLPPALRNEAEVRLRALQPKTPDRTGLSPHMAGSEIETAHFTIALDPQTGAIHRLRAKNGGRDWASSDHPLGLFAYQTLSAKDYEDYRAAYIIAKTWWAPMDFGKPGIEKLGAESHVWLPRVCGCWAGKIRDGFRVLAALQITDTEAERADRVAWPGQMYLELLFPDSEPAVHVDLTCLGKAANRLPEAMWLSFLPVAPEQHGWTIDKVDQQISPFDVVKGGNRHMHAVTKGIYYKDSTGNFSIETLDAPAVALGERSPIYYSNDQPDLTRGFHFSLFNNAWGTNYIQWFGEDTRFRFVLRT